VQQSGFTKLKLSLKLQAIGAICHMWRPLVGVGGYNLMQLICKIVTHTHRERERQRERERGGERVRSSNRSRRRIKRAQHVRNDAVRQVQVQVRVQQE